MRHPSEIDDLHSDTAQLDSSWLAGEIELARERPTTGLRGDSSHRKWMLIGVGGCGLLTAIAVLFLTRGEPQARAAEQPEIEPDPVEQELTVEPAAVTPTPEPVAAPRKPERPTLAATSRAAASEPAAGSPLSEPKPNKAPPAPQPVAEPTGSPSPSPSKPATPGSAPTPGPTPAAADKPSLPE
ncbi:MAG TPA: hypothetical protein VK034_03915, partial [Enhygromyxa sp.]|nr:hypothetical protein [Enhygromyxa sp.]